MPCLLHLKLKLDPLNDPQRSRHFLDPVFSHNAFLLDGKIHFLFIYLFGEKKNMIFRKDLESPLIFVSFLKGKQNKKENPKCDFLFGKDGL